MAAARQRVAAAATPLRLLHGIYFQAHHSHGHAAGDVWRMAGGVAFSDGVDEFRALRFRREIEMAVRINQIQFFRPM